MICRVNFMATNASPEDIIIPSLLARTKSNRYPLEEDIALLLSSPTRIMGGPQLSLSILIWSIIDHVEFGTML